MKLDFTYRLSRSWVLSTGLIEFGLGSPKRRTAAMLCTRGGNAAAGAAEWGKCGILGKAGACSELWIVPWCTCSNGADARTKEDVRFTVVRL